jgi:lysophospholipase L1-like esterase
MSRASLCVSVVVAMLLCASPLLAAFPKLPAKFSFGDSLASGATAVKPETAFTADLGYGFEPRGTLQSAPAGITSDGPISFTVAVPDGNYRVKLTLAGGSEAGATTIKAESRKLIAEQIQLKPGETATRTFTINVRGPRIAGTDQSVMLDPREPPMIWTWDEKLTVTLLGAHPVIQSLEIAPAPDAITVFLIGDSTVTDQVRGDYGTWGQVLPRFFNDKVAIANYAESGETVKAFRHEKRWDKIMSVIKPGDYVFMQFGHNDLNKTGTNAMWPATEFSGQWSNTYSAPEGDYKTGLMKYAEEVKAKGGIPVIVSPMTKVDTRNSTPSNGLGEYPKYALEAAKDAGVASIDLNGLSIKAYTALGGDLRRAVMDGNHSNTYGGYILARCMVEGIRSSGLDLAKYIADDAGSFDPNKPQPLPDAFALPTDPGQPNLPSFGGGGRRGARGAGRGPATGPATSRGL